MLRATDSCSVSINCRSINTHHWDQWRSHGGNVTSYLVTFIRILQYLVRLNWFWTLLSDELLLWNNYFGWNSIIFVKKLQKSPPSDSLSATGGFHPRLPASGCCGLLPQTPPNPQNEKSLISHWLRWWKLFDFSVSRIFWVF